MQTTGFLKNRYFSKRTFATRSSITEDYSRKIGFLVLRGNLKLHPYLSRPLVTLCLGFDSILQFIKIESSDDLRSILLSKFLLREVGFHFENLKTCSFSTCNAEEIYLTRIYLSEELDRLANARASEYGAFPSTFRFTFFSSSEPHSFHSVSFSFLPTKKRHFILSVTFSNSRTKR